MDQSPAVRNCTERRVDLFLVSQLFHAGQSSGKEAPTQRNYDMRSISPRHSRGMDRPRQRLLAQRMLSCTPYSTFCIICARPTKGFLTARWSDTRPSTFVIESHRVAYHFSGKWLGAQQHLLSLSITSDKWPTARASADTRRSLFNCSPQCSLIGAKVRAMRDREKQSGYLAIAMRPEERARKGC